MRTLHDRHLHLLESAEPNCLVVITGTKKDLIASSKRAVSEEAGLELAKQQNKSKDRPLESLSQIPFFETSAKTGENVDNVFNFIFKTCLPLDDKEMASMYAKKHTGVDLESKSDTKCGSHGKCCSLL